MNINFETARDALDFLKDVQAQWEWKRDSIEKYNREMRLLDKTVTDLDCQIQSQLPTVQDVQQAFREAQQNTQDSKT